MDITNRLGEEHQRLIRLFEKFDSLESSAAKNQMVLQLVQELSVHEAAEESAVWPELKDAIGDTSRIDAAVREEGELKQLLQQMNSNPGSDEAVSQVGRLRELLMRHLGTEQDQVFPQVETLDESKRQQLAESYDASKNALIDRMAKLNVTMAPEAPVEQRQQT